MDSTDVNRGIKADIWPLLKEQGFGHFSSRSAWRFHADRTDVVNFQSFNSYRASVIGCTTFSFNVNLGCYFTCIPYQYGPTHVKTKKEHLLPDESQCHVRGSLRPPERRSFLERFLGRTTSSGIWLINEDGSNLSSSLTDVRRGLVEQGLAWFDQFISRNDVLQLFSTQEERIGELWGFGNDPSPIRSYCVGFLALDSGDFDVAVVQLKAALISGCFGTVEKQLQAGIETAQQGAKDRRAEDGARLS